MTIGPDHFDFYAALPAFSDAAGITDISSYHPVPDDWCVISTDIVNSTNAVNDGRYKTVNTAGASVISAISNHLQHRDFPFVFGGDGAAAVLPAQFAPAMQDVLARVCTWVSEQLDLQLRAAIMPVSAIRDPQATTFWLPGLMLLMMCPTPCSQAAAWPMPKLR